MLCSCCWQEKEQGQISPPFPRHLGQNLQDTQQWPDSSGLLHKHEVWQGEAAGAGEHGSPEGWLRAPNSFYSVPCPIADPFSHAEPTFAWLAVLMFQAHTITDSVSGSFPETPSSDLPWSNKSKCSKTLFQGPRPHKAGGSRTGSLGKQHVDSQVSYAMFPKCLPWSQRCKTAAGTQHPRTTLLPAAAPACPRASSCKQSSLQQCWALSLVRFWCGACSGSSRISSA